MSYLQQSTELVDVPDKEKWKYCQLFLQGVKSKLNGGIQTINSNVTKVACVFTATDTDTTINHGIGRVPRGYRVVSLSAAMIIYDGTIAATNSTITLKSSAVGTAQVEFL